MVPAVWNSRGQKPNDYYFILISGACPKVYLTLALKAEDFGWWTRIWTRSSTVHSTNAKENSVFDSYRLRQLQTIFCYFYFCFTYICLNRGCVRVCNMWYMLRLTNLGQGGTIQDKFNRSLYFDYACFYRIFAYNNKSSIQQRPKFYSNCTCDLRNWLRPRDRNSNRRTSS